ncbi:NAD(P)H-dependent oxidoreductase [Streptomyces sp. NPDC006660]|uniref:NAD(P)H-dependent oxidoreductase n=1 Tax=Streptomyces sp. NPDC006660 TaxID=3156901 RepID=UPI0033D8E898
MLQRSVQVLRLKSFVDVIDRDALVGKPTLIAATGGTARHSLALEYALRSLFVHLRAQVVPTAVFAAPEDWGSADGRTRRVRRPVHRWPPGHRRIRDRLGRLAGAGTEPRVADGQEASRYEIFAGADVPDTVGLAEHFLS